MALLETPEKDSGFEAVDFNLKGTDGNKHTLQSCMGEKGIVVMFICNHCPYVKAVIHRLVDDCKQLQAKGIGCVAIMPNDTVNYPQDSFDNMKLFAKSNGFTFPYLIDETQEVARAYGAVCTPDIYGFDADGTMVYRGRVDSAGPNEAKPGTKRELLEAMSLVAEDSKANTEQFPSMGGSIKWR